MHRVSKPLIVGIAVIFFGSIIVTEFKLYELIPHIDKMFHVGGGFIVAWFFIRLWTDHFKSFKKFQSFIISLSLAALVGYLWELAEYSTSLPIFTNYPIFSHYLYIGSITDTLGDLFADMFGAGLFTILRFCFKSTEENIRQLTP